MDILLPIMILNLPVKLPRNIPCVVWNPSKEPRQKKAVTTSQKRIIEENLSIWYTLFLRERINFSTEISDSN